MSASWQHMTHAPGTDTAPQAHHPTADPFRTQLDRVDEALSVVRAKRSLPNNPPRLQQELQEKLDTLIQLRSRIVQSQSQFPPPSAMPQSQPTPQQSVAQPARSAAMPPTFAAPSSSSSSSSAAAIAPAPPSAPSTASAVATSGASRSATLPPQSAMYPGPSSSSAQPSQQQAPQDPDKLLGKRRLTDLISQIDPTYKVDVDVTDLLMDLADEFIESTTRFACDLAKHRKSNTLEVKDVQLYLESHYKMRIPGFFAGASGESLDIHAFKRRQMVAQMQAQPALPHNTRVASVKKAVFDENVRREKVREKAKEKEGMGN